jgi:hypothetical protein
MKLIRKNSIFRHATTAPFMGCHFLFSRFLVFFVILTTVFSPFGNLVVPYLPEQIAEQVETHIARAGSLTDDIIFFYNPASASSDVNTGWPSGGGTLSSDWSCISCSGGAYDNKFPVGSSSFGTGGAKTHATGATLSNSSASTQNASGGSGGNPSATAHTHGLSFTNGTASNYPLYGRLMMIKYTGVDPLTELPDNVIAMFDGAPPAGWTTLTTWDDRIIIASDSTDPADGGSDTHSHTLVWGSLTAASETINEDTGPATSMAADHTHSAPSPSSTDNRSNVPQHASLIFATTNGTVSDFTGVIGMFDAAPDASYWTTLSGSSGVLENDFIEASTSYSAAPGGINTHTHADVTSGDSGAPVGSTVSVDNGTGSAQDDHTHTITATMPASIVNRPPYKGIIFAECDQAACAPAGVTSTIVQRAYVFQDDGVSGDPEENANTAAANTALTGVKIGQRFIARFQLDGEFTNQNFKVQYDRNDSNWRELGLASAAFYPAPLSFGFTPLLTFASRSLSTNQAGACNGGKTYVAGEIIPNSIYANTINVGSTECTELAFGIRTASVSHNTTYRFRLFNWTASQSMTFSQYPTVTTVTSGNDTIRYSKFMVNPSVTGSQSYGFLAASASYFLPMPLDQTGYASVSTDNSKYDVLASQAWLGIGTKASASNLFFQQWKGMYNLASESINTIGWNGTYWITGGDRAKIVRIHEGRDALFYVEDSADLSNWAATAAVRTIQWNGSYWLIGGDGAELNRCNSRFDSCTDVSGNLSGFGTNNINTLYWNGTYWLVGGNRTGATEGLNRCNFDITSCTNVAGNLTDWGTTDAVLTVHWGNDQWFVGGQNAQANTCVSAVNSACTDVDTNLSGFSTDSILSSHWNGTYWVVAGQNADINRCTGAISCTDVSSSLVNWGASNHASASYWNGTYWLIGGSGNELNRCNIELTSCADVTNKLSYFSSSGVGAILWNGSDWLVGGDGGRLNKCSFDAVACDDLYDGPKGFMGQNINETAASNSYIVFVGSGPRLNRCGMNSLVCTDITSNLQNFGTLIGRAIGYNGTYWLIGGGTGSTPALNRCNSNLTSCTDVVANLTGFSTNVIREKSIAWNGTNWLIGGESGELGLCNSDVTSCTPASGSFNGWDAQDVLSVFWNGTDWLIGGPSAELNSCNAGVTSCSNLETSLQNFGAGNVRAIASNGTYLMIAGDNAKINRCNLAATSCTDVTNNLAFMGSAHIRTVEWNGHYWFVTGNSGRLNVCNNDATICTFTNPPDDSANFTDTAWTGKHWVLVAGSSKLYRIYDRFPVYHFVVKNTNDNGTDNITATVNLKSSIPAASRSFSLQAFNFNTNKWVTQAVNNTLASGSQGTLTGTINSGNANYFSQSYGSANGYWTHWRFYASAGFETINMDYINVAFETPAVQTTYTQNDHQWFENNNGVQPGTALASENGQATVTNRSNPVRLRMNVTMGNDSLSVGEFTPKLQWASSISGPWTDVGATGSSDVWRFNNNPSATSGADITSNILTDSDIRATYQEGNPALANPRSATAGQDVEWDFALDPRATELGSLYYFRMVHSSGTALDTYNTYPAIRTGVGHVPVGGGATGGGVSGSSGSSGGGVGNQGGGGGEQAGGGGSGSGGSEGGGEEGGGGGGGASPVIFFWILVN